jgi:hypothetical protein
MKTLTVRQPWADLIVSGRRHFEIRTWKPETMGWILIHAGRKPDEEACRHFELPSTRLTLGAILGKVNIRECIEFTPQKWEELRSEHLEWSDFRPGLLGWRLDGAVKFDRPIPWSGSLGLFEVPEHIVENAGLQADAQAGFTPPASPLHNG